MEPAGKGIPSSTFLQNQIGISISSGNYINTTGQADQVPTWKKLAAD